LAFSLSWFSVDQKKSERSLIPQQQDGVYRGLPALSAVVLLVVRG